jgi:chemotaxis protein CheZ
VVASLKQLEDCIDRITRSFGHEVATSEQTAAADRKSSHDDGLLNGPQMPGAANSQADIDALLASFD